MLKTSNLGACVPPDLTARYRPIRAVRVGPCGCLSLANNGGRIEVPDDYIAERRVSCKFCQIAEYTLNLTDVGRSVPQR